MDMKKTAVLYAVGAAVCYGASTPLSKLLLLKLSPAMLSALLYLGAGLGMLVMRTFSNKQNAAKEAAVTMHELPYVLAMIVLDVAAPILLMLGLTRTTPATISLINNFEIVATAVIAFAFFREAIGRRLIIAIILITVSTMLLSVEDYHSLSFSIGAIFSLLACVCWGLENNCTRMLSLKDPLQIVTIKGLGSGAGALLIALLTRSATFDPLYILYAMVLGFLAYGLSIFYYILAQRELGAARTSAYYAFAPFVGVALSFLVYGQRVTWGFVAALLLMLLGSYFTAFEKHQHPHTHEPVEHEHRHNHADGHHTHTHESPVAGEHSHLHQHETFTHAHAHTPDLHHTHSHG